MSKYQDHIIWNQKSFPQKLNPEEDIVMVTRQDIAILIFKTISYFLVFFVLFLVRLILSSLVSDVGVMALYDGFLWGTAVVLIVAYTLMFHNYYLSMQIVTSDRLIDIDQQGLFKREVKELDMGNIENVTYKQEGFWSTVLNYGNVIVETAANTGGNDPGEAGNFVFERVPSPKDVSAEINNLYHLRQSTEKEESARLNADAMRQVLEKNGIEVEKAD